jgi:hypothetical protein
MRATQIATGHTKEQGQNAIVTRFGRWATGVLELPRFALSYRQEERSWAGCSLSGNARFAATYDLEAEEQGFEPSIDRNSP